MTYKEIEGHRKRLQELVETWHVDGQAVKKGDFQKLARKIGASTRSVYIYDDNGSGETKPVGCDAGIGELIDNIHQALQTASMIDALKAANRSWIVAVIAALIALVSTCVVAYRSFWWER